MKTSSRWLLIFGVTIGVLVIAAVVLVLTMPTPETRLLPEDTPEGIVQRYFLALEAEDYVTAYSYLSPPPSEKIPYEDVERTSPLALKRSLNGRLRWGNRR